MGKQSTPESRWEKRVLIRTLAGWFKNWKGTTAGWLKIVSNWLFGTNAGMVCLMFILILAFMAIAAIEKM